MTPEAPTENDRRPRVFVSYAWESSAFRERVAALASRLFGAIERTRFAKDGLVTRRFMNLGDLLEEPDANEGTGVGGSMGALLEAHPGGSGGHR